MKTAHDFDCTINAAIHEGGMPHHGICTCGYGWGCVRKGDWSQMYSQELQEKLEEDYQKLPAEQRKEIEGLLEKLMGAKN